MSKLIQIYQRIKAIETVKKITHAMRLTSMSIHSRLQVKKKFLIRYKSELHNIFLEIHHHAPSWHHSILSPAQNNRHLVILVGSQKGLCGNFNASLYVFAEEAMRTMQEQGVQLDIIIIGKKMIDYEAALRHGSIIKKYSEFNFALLEQISQDICTTILEESTPYSHVTLFNNYPKSFFSQKAQAYQLIPFGPPLAASTYSQELIFEEAPDAILDALAERLILISIQEQLFLSLIAEQASRFITMDSSSRNAKNLLDAMRLNYNKIRQTKITRELTDLAGGFF